LKQKFVYEIKRPKKGKKLPVVLSQRFEYIWKKKLGVGIGIVIVAIVGVAIFSNRY